jgi:hypothetical protein
MGLDAWTVITNRNDAQLIELPRRRPLTLDEWRNVPYKGLESGLPTELVYNAALSGGKSTITVHPIPDVDHVDIVLYLREAIAELEDGVQYEFPDAYESALVNNIAVRLKKYFPDAMLDPQVYRDGTTALTLIKRNNWQPSQVFDTAPWSKGGHYDIYGDEYTGRHR